MWKVLWWLFLQKGTKNTRTKTRWPFTQIFWFRAILSGFYWAGLLLGLDYFLGWTLNWARLAVVPLGCFSRLFISAVLLGCSTRLLLSVGIHHRWGDVPASRSDAKVRNNVMVFQIKSLLPFSCANLLFIEFRWWAFYSTFGLSYHTFLLLLHPLVQVPYLNWTLLWFLLSFQVSVQTFRF